MESLRTEDGSVSLGDFLKLTDIGATALEEAGIVSTDVAVMLDGACESLRDERDISGSREDAALDQEKLSSSDQTASAEPSQNNVFPVLPIAAVTALITAAAWAVRNGFLLR